jgi:glycosyltransferase involved in cell wall biosynthesis
MPRGEPAVSVVTAVYNGERFLRPAIESVLAQTRGDFEFLIVDDGSTDGTPYILDEYARQDARIRVHRISHAGRSAAANFGCRQARAGFIARLDADDLALPNRLEDQLRFLRRNDGVALLGGSSLLINERGEVFAEDRVPTSDSDLRQELELWCPFYHSAVVFRKRAVEEVGGYRVGLEQAEDYDLFRRIAERYSVASVAEFVAKCRYSPRQASAAYVEAQAVALVAVRAAARDRREGRPDRLETTTQVGKEALLAGGVEEQELEHAVAQLGAWYSTHVSNAGPA